MDPGLRVWGPKSTVGYYDAIVWLHVAVSEEAPWIFVPFDGIRVIDTNAFADVVVLEPIEVEEPEQ